MMEAQLHALLEGIHRKIQLDNLLPKWKSEYEELSQLTTSLHTAMLNEQSDVEKLEAGGIGTVIHKLTGRMEEKLDKERQEAENATNEYRNAEARLNEIKSKIDDGEKELESLQDCKSKYIEIMQAQITQLESIAQNPCNAEQAESLKIQLQLERRRKSLREALLESGEADREADQNLDILQQMQDMIKAVESINFPLNDQMKYLLQDAEFHAQQLIEEISDLQAKLAQMGIDPDPHISIGPYLKAPMVFIEGSDTSSMNQIGKAINQIEELKLQITSIDEKMEQALKQIEERLLQF